MVDSLINLIQKSSITDWIQALGSIAAIFIAYVSLVVSKRALDTGVRTQLRITRATFNPETSHRASFEVMITNFGHSDAFEINLYGYFIENTQRVDVDERRSLKYFDTNKWELKGPTEIKPGDTASYSISKDTYFSFENKLPLILTFELASGTDIKQYWKFNTDRSKSDYRFIKMSPLEIKKYKLLRLWVNIKHPFVIVHKRFNLKKQRNK